MKNKEHILKLIDLLYNECISAGGDGDVIWYSRLRTTQELMTIVEEYNNTLPHPFELRFIQDDSIEWGANQEWIIITNNENIYNNWPDYGQFVLKY